ncbi:MAG TPA: hypothetical protein VIJ32_00815 [Actinomycetes bacterium]
MPTDRDFKRLVRARMGRTGEAYTTARAHLRPHGDPDRPDPGLDPDPSRPGPLRGRHPDTAALTRPRRWPWASPAASASPTSPSSTRS